MAIKLFIIYVPFTNFITNSNLASVIITKLWNISCNSYYSLILFVLTDNQNYTVSSQCLIVVCLHVYITQCHYIWYHKGLETRKSYYLLDLYIYEVFDPPANMTAYYSVVEKSSLFVPGDCMFGGTLSRCLVCESSI